MKLHPRLISSAARSLFGQVTFTPRHTLAPRALANEPLFPTRDFEPSEFSSTPVQTPSLAQPLFFWVVGAGLASIYFIWFFSDLLPQTVR